MLGYQNCFVCFLFLAAQYSLQDLSSLATEYWIQALAVKVLVPNNWACRESLFTLILSSMSVCPHGQRES